MTPRELVAVREFGRGDNGSDQGPAFGASPDGQRIALVVRRADPAHNLFCQALVIVTRGGSAAPKVIPLNVQPVHQSYDLRGFLTANGLISANPPRWSPDGKTIAILAPHDGTVQVLGVSTADGHSDFLTDASGGVIDFAWSGDGRSLIYSTRPGLSAFEAAADREAMVGYHYDGRVVPLLSPRPQPPASLAIAYRAVVRAGGHDRIATAKERGLLYPGTVGEKPAQAITEAAGQGKLRAWLVPSEPGKWMSPIKLVARADGQEVTCDAPACSGRLTHLWVAEDSFLFLKREGWGDSLTALYRWRPGTPPQRLFATEDLLTGCDVVGGVLLCGKEGSLEPRRLWSYDPATGRQSTIFDPNPGFERHRLPRVERLHWSGPLGVQGFGDLVLPAGAAPTNGYPMIVVQYRTRGFLKGATGDEFPILSFATHGFAVLSIENAPDYASLVNDPAIRTITQAVRLDYTDNHERRSQYQNLEGAITAARAYAPIDMTRLGIAGISDAAASAIYAIDNGRLFATASLGSPGWDPFLFAIGGPALRESFSAYGFPTGGPAAEAFYKSVALEPNAGTMRTPILLQYPGDEYLAAMGSISALEAANAPIDAYVFPSEPHVKWQPGHRLALYRRNLAWFDFWLRDHEDVDAAEPEELARWRALRAQLCSRSAADGAPIQLCSQASTSTSSVTRR
ncbi:MAG: Atxe2 family lasso peptide isopeptidase [Sphingomonas sp.]